MRLKWLAVALVAGSLVSSTALAQTLFFGNSAAQVGPDGNSVPGTPDSAAIGAMAQLIVDSGTDGQNPPSYDGTPNPEDSTGIQPGDTFAAFTWAGKGSTGDGIWFDTDSFANLGISGSDDIYVRVYSNPSSDSAGNMPTAMDYNGIVTDAGLVSQMITAGTTVGTFYFDGPVVLVSTIEQGSSGIFNYTIPTFAIDQWTFLSAGAAVVPEPGTFALLGLGGLVLGLRKRRQK